ncbi:uncharacterized protein LOC111704175 [Eurytemora carolleeae]|uniref:uncharacterized protein LOC111704175 n=1 Tax=Eurytemora carolleeae TaxID=1294199 RepID=UPI000C766ADD|nr:uncharacterized protein LOC111704175 [Eurytemora carolleeae]|eukprot:XP_023332096.1 uncharacterized protein LOC111704175 [Eurytemora affinis]
MIKIYLFSVFSFAALVKSDWTGSGVLECYGHVNVDASFPAGAGNAGPGSVTCNPVEWDYDTGLGPEAMFFHPNSGESFEIWAWDYHGSIPSASCTGELWYKEEDMGAGFCTPNKGYNGCGIVYCTGEIVCDGC